MRKSPTRIFELGRKTEGVFCCLSRECLGHTRLKKLVPPLTLAGKRSVGGSSKTLLPWDARIVHCDDPFRVGQVNSPFCVCGRCMFYRQCPLTFMELSWFTPINPCDSIAFSYGKHRGACVERAPVEKIGSKKLNRSSTK